MSTLIDAQDIKVGDLVRSERGEVASEWRVGENWHPPQDDATYYLIERPRTPIWRKGQTIYGSGKGPYADILTKHEPNVGEEYVVTRDYFEGEDFVEVRSDTNPFFSSGSWYPSRFTDEKPKKVIHEKGKTLWFTDANRTRAGQEVRVVEDVSEGDDLAHVVVDGYRGKWALGQFTDLKPRVLKWAKGTTLYEFEGGKYTPGDTSTFEVLTDVYEGDSTVHAQHSTFSMPVEYHGAIFTDVPPTVTTALIPVRKDAIDKLRGEHHRAARNALADHYREGNRIRRDAIDTFLRGVDA